MKLKFISIFMLIVLLFSFSVGCGEKEKEKQQESEQEIKFEDTSDYLLLNGSSDYKIVIPQNADTYESFAADEFNSIFNKATNTTLPIITDDAVISGGKYISIGNTKLKSNAGITVDKEGDHAFDITYKDGILYLTGSTQYGTTLAVYRYMNFQFGYVFYADDEIYVEQATSEKFLNIVNYEYAPFLTNVHIGKLERTMEANLRYQTVLADYPLGWPHSHTSLLIPKSMYYDEHPEWFVGPDPSFGYYEICLTNPELIQEMANRIIYYLDTTTYEDIFMGIEDCHLQCSCDNCQASNDKYTYSGTNIIFTNKVCEIVEQHYKDLGIDKDFTLWLMAYYGTQVPPVKVVNNERVPIYDEVVCNKHIGIHMTYYTNDYSKPYHEINGDKTNESARTNSEGWRVLSKASGKFSAYVYSGYFVKYRCMFFDDFEYKADWIKAMGENGCNYVHFESLYPDTFYKLRTYYIAQLCYDVNQNTNLLIKDFIEHYYKEAAEYVQEYFDLISSHFKAVRAGYEAQGKVFGMFCEAGTNPYLWDASTLPEIFLRQLLKIMGKAYEAIENSARTSAEKEVLRTRIFTEEVFARYNLLKLYKTSFSTTEYKQLAEQCMDDMISLGYYTEFVHLEY